MTNINGLTNPFENAVESLNYTQLEKQKRLDDYAEAVGLGYEPPQDILDGIIAILADDVLDEEALAALQDLLDQILAEISPIITSNGGGDAATISFDENSTALVTTVTAIDQYSLNDETVSLVYSIGGADAALFVIDASTGELSFLAPPDFEGGQQTYSVVVTAHDGDSLLDSQDITVNINDVNEAPTLAAGLANATEDGPTVDVDLAALGDDVDGDDDGTTLSYVVTGQPSEGTASISETTLTFDPGVDFQDLAVGETRDVVVQITATDGHGATATNDVVITVTGTNEAPIIIPAGLPFQSEYDVADIVAGTADMSGLVINGVAVDDRSGTVLAGAGDLNGDGIDDVIVSAFVADIDGSVDVGATYVVFGAENISGPIDLVDLDGTNGFRISGIDPGDVSGTSASFAGDINGDGIDDLIIGSPRADQGASPDVGEAYVVYGSTSFDPIIDLVDLDGSNGFQIDGIDTPNGVDRLGHAVSSAGDVNGDRIDDFIVSADAADPGGVRSRGEAYVVFGSADFGASFDLTTLDGTNGFRLPGLDLGDFAGRAVSSAGDVNNDGYDDIIVGSVADANGPGSGETYVVFGAETFQPTFDFNSLDGTNGFTVPGVSAGNLSGTDVSALGDVNGDGIDDIVVGIDSNAATTGSTAGEAYVIFGTDSGFDSVIDPLDLDGTNGFLISGVDNADRAGRFVSTPGDVNNDGINDIVISAIVADPDGNDRAGETYVVFGQTSFDAEVALSSLDGSNGYRIDGIDPNDESGFSVSTAGDFNDDGIDDFVFGAPGGDPAGVSNAGESYVIFGREGSQTAGVISEIPDGEVGEGNTTLTTDGSFEFSDLDLADTHTASFQFVSATHSTLGDVPELGTFSTALSQQPGSGLVDWQFSVLDSGLDPLDQGDSVVQVYDVIIDDGTDFASLQITVTLFGADDF